MQEDLILKLATSGAEAAASKVKSVSDSISDSAKETSNFNDKLQKASLAIGAVGVGLTAYSKNATDTTVAYVKSVAAISRVTGESVEETSRLQYVFQRSGIAADQASQVFGIFSKNIIKTNEAVKEGAAGQADLANKIEAAKIKIADLTKEQAKNGDSTGTYKNQIDALNISITGYQKKLSEAATPLQRIGVATQDANGKTRGFSDILLDVADKFKELPNGAEKSTLAMELFGRSGKSLIGVLSKGSDGIRELESQADKLGLTLTSSNVAAVFKYTEAQKKLKDAQQALTIAIGTQALPMWQALADVQLRAVDYFQRLPAPIRAAAAAVLSFGGPVLTAGAGLASFAGNLATAITAIKGATAAQTAFNVAMRLSPLALVATAAIAITTAYIGVVTQSDRNTLASERLKLARDNLTVATNTAKDAENNLKNAQLDSEGAALRVESAQRNYNNAVAEYGPNSFEARNAAYDLKRANDDLAAANQNVTDKTKAAQKAEEDKAKSAQAVKDALNTTRDAAYDAAGGYGALANNIAKAREEDAKTGVLNDSRKQTQAIFKVPGRAVGGPVSARSPYVVGEEGPELFIPKNSGTIIPNGSSSGSAPGGGGLVVNIRVDGNLIGGDNASLRSLAVQMAQLTVEAVRSQGVSSVSQLRATP